MRKQRLVINKLQNVTIESKDIEMMLKQEETTEIKSFDKPPQAESVTEVSLHIPSKSHSKSEDVEFLSQNHSLSEHEPVPSDREYALPAKLPGVFNLSNPMFEEMESNLMYQSLDECYESPMTTNVPQGINVC